jgi:hypothetical protein
MKRSKSCAVNAGDGVIFEDGGMELFSVETGRGADEKAGPGLHAPFQGQAGAARRGDAAGKELTGMSLRGASDLFIGSGGRNYQLCADGVCCTSKIRTACSCLGSPVGYGV